MNHLSGSLTMWSRACARLDEAERRQRRFFELLAARSQMPSWEPPVDIFLLGREMLVRVALPGVPAEALEIQLAARGLFVRAVSPLPALVQQARIERLEIPYGRFERLIELPPGRYELLARELRDGCLNVRLRGDWP
jgi:HSP20 family molecular chaperone IbpA